MLLDPRQIYTTEDFFYTTDNNLLVEKTLVFLKDQFNITGEQKSVYQTNNLSNDLKYKTDYEFLSIFFRSDATFVTSQQSLKPTKDTHIFFAGRIIDFEIKAEENLTVIEWKNVIEL